MSWIDVLVFQDDGAGHLRDTRPVLLEQDQLIGCGLLYGRAKAVSAQR